MKKKFVALAALCALALGALSSCGFNTTYDVNVGKKTVKSTTVAYYEEDELDMVEDPSSLTKSTYAGRTVYKSTPATETLKGSKKLAQNGIYLDSNKAIMYLATDAEGAESGSQVYYDLMDPNNMRFIFNKKPVKSNGKISGKKVTYSSYSNKNVLYVAFNKTPLKAKKVTASVKNGGKTSKSTVYFKTKGIIKKITVNGENTLPFITYKNGKVYKDCVKLTKKGKNKVKVWLVSGATKTFTFRYK